MMLILHTLLFDPLNEDRRHFFVTPGTSRWRDVEHDITFLGSEVVSSNGFFRYDIRLVSPIMLGMVRYVS